MKNLSLLALLPLLSLVQPAGAETSTAILERRCSEQERQIQQLEEENSRLRSLLETATKMDAPKKANPSPKVDTQAPAAPSTASKPVYYTVSQGDTLSRIAGKNGTTAESLAHLNNLKVDGLIRPGQKLKLPQSAVVPSRSSGSSAEMVASSPANRGGTHTVKQGETFFGIARKYGLSVETLTAANPKVDPRALRIGQSLQLVPGASAPVAASKAAPAPKSQPAPSPAAETSSKPVSNQPKIRSVRIDKEITFGDFAAAHSMEPAKLNALNGLHLESSTVLAKGSELYVSAQP
ncbi:LysM peptidoglycan-binding domain-containing protein [Haloferula chungangensis]|uniref:LysM peptidoglycan-binding domain-containing protein n=1 Tax=Haloferula chungangensis TaxID=1048331 RepID=A0ABW2L1H6_9BACT